MVKCELAYAKIKDLDILVKHRLGMFNDMYPELRKEIQESEEQTRKWIKEMLLRALLSVSSSEQARGLR